MFHVLDLFCGAGGLSLGFMQTGRYVIDVAAEINPSAQETYLHNHENVIMYDDVSAIDYNINSSKVFVIIINSRNIIIHNHIFMIM